MGSATFIQTSFAGGAWSPFNQGRYDHAWYRKSMAVSENGFPLSSGGWVRRPGTQLAGPTRNGAKAALIPFSFENNDPYVIELTEGFLRYFQGPSLATDETATVTDISTATPAVVTLGSGVTWATGEQVVFNLSDAAAKAAAPLLAARTFVITMLTTTTFSLSDPIVGASVDGSTLGWAADLIVTAGRVAETVTPYTAAQVGAVRGVQNETDMVLLQGDTFPQILTATPPDGDAPAVFELNPAEFVDGPYFDPEPNGVLTPDAVNGLINLVLSSPAYSATKVYAEGDFVLSSSITYRSLVDQNLNHTPASSPTYWGADSPASALASGVGFTEDDIGRHIRLYTEPPAWETGTTYAAKDVVYYDGLPWVALTGITGAAEALGKINTTRPGVDSTKWAVAPQGARWTWGKIVGIPDPSSFISQTLAGSGTIGNLSRISAGFDGNTSQESWEGPRVYWEAFSNPDAYIGRSFSSPLAITSVKVYPLASGGMRLMGSKTFTLRVRAKSTAPSNATDGTVIGTATITNSTQYSPVIVTSTDQATTWSYVWLDLSGIPQETVSGVTYEQFACSEIEMFGAGAGAGAEVTVQLYGDDLLYVSPIHTWRLGLFNQYDNKYPACGCYHEGRLWLAGVSPNRVDASKSNEFLVFSPTETDGSVPDNAAISYTFNSSDLNSIYWMIPDLQGIVAGTKGGEWLIESPSNSSAGFTPTNIRARRVTKYGCANIEPQRTGLTTVFVHRYKRQMVEFLADAYSGKFVGPEMAELNRQAVAAGIEQIAYQQGLVPIVWSRLADGSLSGATYRRTSMISTQPPDILGWHQHTLGHGRTVENICTGPAVGGELDALSLVTKDAASGLYYVEVMANLFDEDANIFQARHLDGALVPAAAQTSGDNIRLHGLWPLNGQTVTVWAAGLDCGDFKVMNGYVDVPLGSAGGLFTKRWLTQLHDVAEDFDALSVTLDGDAETFPAVVGFSYRSRGQVLRPVAQDATGSAQGPAFAKIRRQGHVGVQMYKSQGVSLGTNFDRLRPAIFRTPGDRAYAPTELWSGIFWGNVDDGYTFESQLCWEVTRPYPLTITAVGGEYVTQN